MKAITIVLISCAVLLGLTITCYAYDIVQVTNTPEVDERGCSITIFGNTVYATWVTMNSSGVQEIYFDKSTDLGKTWGAYKKVLRANITEYIDGPKILISNNGKIFIFYNLRIGSRYPWRRYESYLGISEDDGETFVYKEISSDDSYIFSYGGFDFAIDETGDHLYIVGIGPHYNEADYTTDIYMWKSVDGGNTFSDRRVIFSVRYGGEIEIETSRDGKDVYLFLVIYPWTTGYLAFTKSLDYGENFTPLKRVIPFGMFYYQHFEFMIDSVLDMPTGKIYVSWSILQFPQGRPPPSTWLSESSDQGENFSHTPINDIGIGSGAISSSISVDKRGNVYCTFLKDDGMYYDKRFGADNFGTDEFVVTGPFTGPYNTSWSGPLIAVTPSGKTAFIMWNNSAALGANRDLYCTTFATGSIIEVGGPNPDYSSIQEAIDNSQPGYTVYVHSGEYQENLILKDGVSLEGAGKDQVTVYGTINVGSNCTLEGITFIYEIPNTSSYILLKIASSNVIVKDCSFNLSYNGTASMSYGNFLAYLKGNNITLEANNFNFTSSSSYYMRGIYTYACSDITLRKNRLTLKDNSIQRGYYIYGFQSVNSKDITLENNIIDARGNNATGIYAILLTAHKAAFDNATVKNNTIFLRSNYPYNRYLTGIYSYQLAHLNIRNNIIDLGTTSSYYSKPCSITYYTPSTDTDTNTSTSTSTDTTTDTYIISDIKVTYNIYDGSYTCIYKYPSNLAIIEHDNIKAYPIFVNPDQGDFHLSVASPAIDKGDPKDPYSLEPQPNGGRIDCGAYGNTKEAAVR